LKKIEVGTFFEEVLIKDKIEVVGKSETGYDFSASEKFLIALQQEKKFFIFLKDRILVANAVVVEVDKGFLSSDVPKLGYDPRLKRRFPRATVGPSFSVTAEFFNVSKSYCIGKFLLRDVSENGMSVIVPKDSSSLFVGRELFCSFSLPGINKSINVKCVVVNQEEVEEDHRKMGIFFTDVSNRDRDKIALFVTRRHREIVRSFG